MSRLKSELKRLRLAVVILILVAIGLGAVALSQRNEARGIPDLATAVVETRDVKKIIGVDGNLAGVSNREVYLPTNAEITSLDVEVGDRVEAGKVLARIETSTGFETRTEDITAGIKGVVTAVNYELGDSVSPGLAAFTIVDDSEYQIVVFVNENDVIDIENGQEAVLVLPAISLDEEFSGMVKSVAPAPPSISGVINYLTIITPEELPENVRLGMSVSAEIIAAQVEDVLAIPESFLIERDDSIFVKRITWLNDQQTEYELTEVEVEIGLRTDEFVEIESGLRLGDELVEPSFTQQRGFGFFN